VDRRHLIGAVKTAFELHSFHGDQWLIVKESGDLRELEPAAAMLVQRGEVDGIRLVRRTDYLDHGLSLPITIVKRLRAGVVETDPLQRANPGRDASWCDKPEDLHGDLQRQVFRGILSKWLDEKRLTPLEVLNYEVHAKALDQAGTTLQGALQRLASTQVRGTKQTAVARMKELITIADDGLARLVKAGKGNPPAVVQPGGFGELSLTLSEKGGDPLPALYRAVAAYLADAKTWVEKLDRLFRLWEPSLGVREMRVLDSMAAEILASPFALKELAGAERTRLELVTNAIDLYVGNLNGAAGGEQPPGVRALSGLLAEGVLPRSLFELRMGLLRHLHSRLPLRSDKGLRDEMKATVEVLAYLRAKAPALARDEEVLEALALRADRLIQPEAMSDMMAMARSVTMRIDLVLGLIEEVPGDGPKAKLAPYLRSLVVPDDIIRESGNRAEGIKPLGGIARRIAASGLPTAARRELLEILDASIFDTIRTEILGAQNLSFTDRILMLVRLCSGLPDGRAKQLAGDTLTQALKRPEFILNYLERFPNPQEKREAYHRLCNAMLESGLVDRSLVPLAA